MKYKFNVNVFMKSIGDTGLLLFAIGVFADLFIEVTVSQIATLIVLGIVLMYLSCFRRGSDSSRHEKSADAKRGS